MQTICEIEEAGLTLESRRTDFSFSFCGFVCLSSFSSFLLLGFGFFVWFSLYVSPHVVPILFRLSLIVLVCAFLHLHYARCTDNTHITTLPYTTHTYPIPLHASFSLFLSLFSLRIYLSFFIFYLSSSLIHSSLTPPPLYLPNVPSIATLDIYLTTLYFLCL